MASMEIGEKGKKIIKGVLEELNGLAFPNQPLWKEKDKKFFEERDITILSFLPKLGKDSTVLEIGLCGGIMAFSLKRISFLQKLYTLEHPVTCRGYTPSFLVKLQTENIILAKCDLHKNKLPWGDDVFDLVVFSEIAEHLIPADLPNILKEIRRVLKPHGFLLLTTPNIGSLVKRLKLLRGENPIEFDLILHEGATYGHIREYTLEEVTSLLNTAGFKSLKRAFFEMDSKRNLFNRFENFFSKLYPPLANSFMILGEKQ